MQTQLPILVMGLLVLILGLFCTFISADVSQYNVVWNNFLPESSSTYVNTMPLGNGDVALNGWSTSSNGAVTVLISKTDAWSESGELIKVGFVEFSFNPSPFSSGNRFRQKLDLPSATMIFELGGDPNGNTPALTVNLRVDSNQNTIVFNTSSTTQFSLNVITTLARTSSSSQTPAFDCMSYTVTADVNVDDTSPISSNPVIAFYHRNADAKFVANTLTQLNLSPLISSTKDILLNRTIGAAVFGNGFKRTSSSQLSSNSPSNSFTVGIAVLTQQTTSVNDYLTALGTLVNKGIPSYSSHLSWWQQFWDRSHIEISNQFTVSSQYALFRFLQAIQARTPWELKFNGMLFVANRPPNVDYRDWGGLNWWQNSRHSYYNMFPAGDFDLLTPFFQFFLNQLPFAQQKTQVWYNRSGAFWDEYDSIIGTTHPSSYGCGRAGKTNPPIWYSEDAWNHYNLQGTLDLSLMILDHYTYTQDDATLNLYLPVITNIIDFYSQYWTSLDNNGKLIFYPSQSIETWQCPNYPPSPSACVTNDAPTIAGLFAVLDKLTQLPSQFGTSSQRTLWKNFLNQIPPLPTTGSGSNLALAPCQQCPGWTNNSENAELYPVHPYRLYTVGRMGAGSADLQVALVAYRNKRFTSDEGWNQNAMDAALLGLANDAKNYVSNRAAMAPADGYRFPAFSPHLQDYQPSQDQLAVMNNALQYMLIQQKEDANNNIVLFPAWPCEWNVDFKVRGPLNTIIEGTLTSGKASITVTPSSRASAVSVTPCQNTSPSPSEVRRKNGRTPETQSKIRI